MKMGSAGESGPQMWKCPNCGEPVDASFEVCWNCGTSTTGESDPDFAPADNVTAQELAAMSRVDDAALGPTTADEETGLKKPRFSLRTMLLLFLAVQAFFAFEMWYRIPKTPRDHFCRARTHFKDGEFQDAIADLDTAVELCDVKGDEAHRNFLLAARAMIRNRLGDHRAALNDINEAIEKYERETLGDLCENASHLALIRVEAYMGLGEYAEAIVDLEGILKYHPRDPTATRMLALARKQTSNTKNATPTP